MFALKIIDTFFIASFIQKLCCGQAESHALYCWMFEGGTWQQADKKELNVVFLQSRGQMAISIEFLLIRLFFVQNANRKLLKKQRIKAN